jgi:mono/diheme cytochrome c family protein
MPQNLVKGEDRNDVATFVAGYAGTGKALPGQQTSGGGTDGKSIFATNCSSCHTLKAAGATGNVGPNLDQLKPPVAIVVRQVTNGGAVMPAFKGKLTPAQIKAVAAFVANNAGK